MKGVNSVVLSTPIITLKESTVKVFPNPASNELFIQSNLIKEYSSLTLKVYNINGVVIEQLSITPQVLKLNVNVDIKAYASGYYFFSFYNENEFLFNGEFIKN